MPFIQTKTSAKVTKEQEAQLVSALNEAITLIPGKTSRYLMLNLIDECRMAFGGTSEPDIAMVEVEILGTASNKVSSV